MATGISERQKIAEQIEQFCSDNNLNNPFLICGRTERKGKSIWSITFSRPRVLDGEVQVWSPTWIMLRTRGILPMPAAVFGNVDDVLEFMRLAWVEHNAEAAMAHLIAKERRSR